MEAPSFVQVWVIQDTVSGNFLGADLEMYLSLERAGRLYDRQAAYDTAVCQFGYDYLVHTFWEVEA